MNKINWKRLLWAIKEEVVVVLGIIFIIVLLALPEICILTKSCWLLLLYPIGAFILGVWEKYNGR